MAALEGGVAALAVGIRTGRSIYCIKQYITGGRQFVSSSHIYGGTYNQFKVAFKRLGIEVEFANGDDA